MPGGPGVCLYLIGGLPVGTELLSTFHYSPGLGWTTLGIYACTPEVFLPGGEPPDPRTHQLQILAPAIDDHPRKEAVTLASPAVYRGVYLLTLFPTACRQLSRPLGFRPMPHLSNNLT